MIARSLATLVTPADQRVGPGLSVRNIADGDAGLAMDPFLVVSLYDMAGPTFPPHPHAGFSVATYILPESPVGFFNQDSLGNRDRIAPGALHVTVAGSGVLHEEQPERTGSLARGYQIWIDHADADREIAPHALHLGAAAMPVSEGDGVSVRVALGQWSGTASPLSPPTPVALLDVTLQPGAASSSRSSLTTMPSSGCFRVAPGSATARWRRVRSGVWRATATP